MKRTILAVVCVILVFIPTYIAIASYVSTQNAPISNSYVEKIEIADLNAKNTLITKTNKEGDLVSFFVSMNASAQKVAELPDPLVGTPFYKVIFYSGNVAEEYKYYFSTDGSPSYVELPDGTVAQLAVSDVNKFLITPYALSLFPDEELPSLTSSLGVPILPSKVDWKYLVSGDKYSSLSGFETSSEMQTYTMEGSVQLNFSSDADLYTVQVYDSENKEIYNGTTTDLTSLDLGGDTDLTIMLTASWYEDSTRKYYGEATYNFKTHLQAGAEFFIGESSVDPGGFVAITGYNVSDPSKIVFTSEPSIGYTPVFFADGDHVVGLVPINVELEHKSYVFTISYGSAKQTMNLSINNKKFGTRTHEVSQITVKNARSEEALAAFNELFEQICAENETTRYFSGNFIDMSLDPSVKARYAQGFGYMRTISATGESYRNIGIDFLVAAGTDIPAANSGKVVYTGITAYGGRMVVIDHGLGLKTWYMHLGECKVAEGDIVKTGDAIGTAGNSGFTETNGVYAIMTVGNVPVCPYSTWENSVIMYTKD
ncbi:MAG: M23 family metallopeptidase [Eubacteriales bacterium]